MIEPPSTLVVDAPSDSPTNPQPRLLKLAWCEGHWAELMFALRDRGLGDLIAATPEELNDKLAAGEADPCWDACNMINIGALQLFGALQVVQENNGCPVCAFANIVQHVADVALLKHKGTH